MKGPLSKLAWAEGLTSFLQVKTKMRLPLIRRLWSEAYFQWLRVQDLVQESTQDIIKARTSHQIITESLQDLCPACFYRAPEDKLPAFVSIDGNFQHRRFKDVGRHEPLEARQKTFVNEVHSSDTTRSLVALSNDLQETGCERRFKAALNAAKPPTMDNLDQNGIVECRIFS